VKEAIAQSDSSSAGRNNNRNDAFVLPNSDFVRPYLRDQPRSFTFSTTSQSPSERMPCYVPDMNRLERMPCARPDPLVHYHMPVKSDGWQGRPKK